LTPRGGVGPLDSAYPETSADEARALKWLGQSPPARRLLAASSLEDIDGTEE